VFCLSDDEEEHEMTRLSTDEWDRMWDMPQLNPIDTWLDDEIATIWLFNSLPWKITMLLIDKPSINRPSIPWLC